MKLFFGVASLSLSLMVGSEVSAQNNPVWADKNSNVTYGSVATNSDDADRQAIAGLKTQGSDITKPTDVIFYLYFPSQAQAEALRPPISSMGFNVDVHKLDGYGVWTLAANKTMVPSESNILELSHKFADLAASQKGEYDGWEAALVK
jgi:hypothetical protein